jgi:hypothetical protein
VRTLILLSLLATVDTPNDSEHVSVHAVLFEIDYNIRGNIRHAQAVAGYQTMEACQGAMPAHMAEFSEKVGPDRTVELWCRGIRRELARPDEERT